MESYLTPQQFADRAQVTRSYVYKLLGKGRIQGKRVAPKVEAASFPERWLIPASELSRFAPSRRRKP